MDEANEYTLIWDGQCFDGMLAARFKEHTNQLYENSTKQIELTMGKDFDKDSRLPVFTSLAGDLMSMLEGWMNKQANSTLVRRLERRTPRVDRLHAAFGHLEPKAGRLPAFAGR